MNKINIKHHHEQPGKKKQKGKKKKKIPDGLVAVPFNQR
jgi:hypothetical protein